MSSGRTTEQWFALIDIIPADYEMKTNQLIEGPNGSVPLDEKWRHAASHINKLGPVQKTGPQWKASLVKLKSRAKKANKEKLDYMGPKTSGGGPTAELIGLGLNPVYEKCMALHSKVALHGNKDVPTPRLAQQRRIASQSVSKSHVWQDFREMSPPERSGRHRSEDYQQISPSQSPQVSPFRSPQVSPTVEFNVNQSIRFSPSVQRQSFYRGPFRSPVSAHRRSPYPSMLNTSATITNSSSTERQRDLNVQFGSSPESAQKRLFDERRGRNHRDSDETQAFDAQLQSRLDILERLNNTVSAVVVPLENLVESVKENTAAINVPNSSIVQQLP